MAAGLFFSTDEPTIAIREPFVRSCRHAHEIANNPPYPPGRPDSNLFNSPANPNGNESNDPTKWQQIPPPTPKPSRRAPGPKMNDLGEQSHDLLSFFFKKKIP